MADQRDVRYIGYRTARDVESEKLRVIRRILVHVLLPSAFQFLQLARGQGRQDKLLPRCRRLLISSVVLGRFLGEFYIMYYD